jgi:4-amino-4-deoxy-L-arabinose transferase-like glycosyltransferase
VEAKAKYLLFILIVGAFIFLFNLGGRDLWEPDETRYAVVAREMRETGDWIIPHLNRAIYAEKPPLFFWLVNLSTFFLGANYELTNRLPSTLAGFITLFITFLFGSKLFNSRVGLLSSLILATCFFFPQISRWMMLDSIFTLFFLLSLLYFYLGFENEKERRRNFLLAGLFMGLGVLTKGPISYLSIPIFLIFAFSQRDIKKFWNRNLLLGFLISVAIVFIWLIPACWIGGETYTKRILVDQIFGRFAEGGKHFHPKSIVFYFVRFPLEFFPWIVFLPTAFILGLRNWKKNKGFLFLFIWFIFIFLFFTLSKGKKDNYILPLYPAAAMMVGVLWDSGLQSLEETKGFIAGFLLLTFLFLIGSVLFLSGIPQKSYPGLQPYHSLGVTILFYLFIGSFLSLLFFIRKKGWVSFISLMLAFAVFQLHLSFSLPPKLNSQRSMRAFSERVLKRMEVGDEIKTYWFKSNGLIYYTKKPYIEEIETTDRFIEVFRSSQRVFIVVLVEMFDKLKKDTGIEIDPIEQVKVGHWNYVLISNR